MKKGSGRGTKFFSENTKRNKSRLPLQFWSLGLWIPLPVWLKHPPPNFCLGILFILLWKPRVCSLKCSASFLMGKPWVDPSQRREGGKGILQANSQFSLLWSLGCYILQLSTSENHCFWEKTLSCSLRAKWSRAKWEIIGEKGSWHNVVKLDQRDTNKPLSKCDQKLPMILIVEGIYSFWLVETNRALHISITFSFYKRTHRFLPPAEAGCLHKALSGRVFFFSLSLSLSKFLFKKKKTQKNPQEDITHLQNEQITSQHLKYTSRENSKKGNSPSNGSPQSLDSTWVNLPSQILLKPCED